MTEPSAPASIDLDLQERPRIVQTGLSLHGARATESACMHGLWCLHAYHYQGKLAVEGLTHPFRAGWVSLIPPEVVAEWHFPSHAAHHYVHFAVAASGQPPVRLPLLQDLGEDFDPFCAQLEQMIRYHPQDPLRAAVRLWDLLQQLRREPAALPAKSPLHTSVQKALAIFRNQPDESLKVSQIAGMMGVSHNHLTRIFKKFCGCGVKQYLQRERLAHARELLAHSSLGIKSISIETGIPDLHYFNKLIRKDTGLSPSAYRKSAAKAQKVKGNRDPRKLKNGSDRASKQPKA